MIIKTETGSEYYIRDGILTKAGDRLTAYKVYSIKPFEHGTVSCVEEIESLPDGEPVVGKRLYISGLGEYNLTTNVVEVIEE